MLEEQLRQAQKMEAVGRLAGGIAHDFNNLLTGIMGSAEMALMGGGIGESVDEYLQDIKQSAERAASLTAQLLAYSRRQVLRPVILDLNDLVSRNQKILSRFLGEHITLETRLHPGAGRVKADPGLFDQVILNLAVNARDAMPEGGRLTIETRSETLDKDFYALHPDVKPGEYVVMSVSDTGHGMDESTLQRIFEPFFTTKETGRGTGLGLSSVYGTVRQSSGHVFVESRPGRGTTFTLYLPRTREKEETEPRPGCCRKGSETILLTEDDQAVRTMMRKVLERYGYSVIETRCGRETLETLEGGLHKEPDLLITDVVMPGMSGGELAQQLSRQYPGLKVLFISGYTGDLVHRHRRAQDSQPGESLKGHGFLQKPFSPDALANKVRDILDDILDETNAVVSL
jgi:CheY-like chemotaxis protein